MRSRSPAPAALAAALAASACLPPNPLPERVDVTRCRPPEVQTTLPVQPEALAGKYRLILIATTGPRASGARDPLAPPVAAVGSLRLRRSSLAYRFPVKLDPSRVDATPVQSPLYGSASIDLRDVGARGVMRSVKSSNPASPGVQTLFYPAWGTLTLVLGAPPGPWGDGNLGGVWLDVWETQGKHLSGWWTDGPAVGDPSAGYFCLERR